MLRRFWLTLMLTTAMDKSILTRGVTRIESTSPCSAAGLHNGQLKAPSMSLL